MAKLGFLIIGKFIGEKINLSPLVWLEMRMLLQIVFLLSKVFCKKVIAEQVGVAKRFPDYAAENRLSEQIADEIYRIIRDVNKDIFEKSES